MFIDWHQYFYIARVLRRNKMRSFLTSLGIIIGISAVIVIMSVGAGARSLVINQVRDIGSDLIGILPGASEANGPPATVMGVNITTLVLDDAVAIKDNVPEIIAICPYVRGTATASWMDKTTDTSFLGVTDSYLNVETTAEVVNGRFISPEEANQLSKPAVLGSQVADDLFGGTNPVGERIKINRESFRIVGVMKSRGSSGIQNQDNQIFIPVQTAQRLMLGINHLSFIRAKMAPDANIDHAIEEIKLILRQRHGFTDSKQDDFSVRSTEQALNTLKDVINALNYFLAMVAGISLLVGGIGIMNIMLVSVSESTKEIGLRKAVGATRSAISQLFLIQTMMLTLLGGVVGIIVGVSISFLISVIAHYMGYPWDFVVSLSSVLLALFFSMAVGLSFGWYPAKKAAQLSPIEALRHE